VAGTLNGGARRAQFAAGPLTRRDEGGIAPHLFDQPLRAPLAGVHVAGEMHAAHQALPCEFGGARQQDVAAFGCQVGK
jgi:hypothetical protein